MVRRASRAAAKRMTEKSAGPVPTSSTRNATPAFPRPPKASSRSPSLRAAAAAEGDGSRRPRRLRPTVRARRRRRTRAPPAFPRRRPRSAAPARVRGAGRQASQRPLPARGTSRSSSRKMWPDRRIRPLCSRLATIASTQARRFSGSRPLATSLVEIESAVHGDIARERVGRGGRPSFEQERRAGEIGRGVRGRVHEGGRRRVHRRGHRRGDDGDVPAGSRVGGGVGTARRPDAGSRTHRLRRRPVGRAPGDLAPGGDRRSLRLHPEDEALVAASVAACPRTVVVVMGGSAVVMPWLDPVPATLMVWYPGMEGGHALADVLTGVAEPGGRLPFAVPTDEDHLVAFDPDADAVVYDLFHGQWKLDRDGNSPHRPFGAGLGYTSWRLDPSSFRVALDGPDTTTGTVSVDVTNTGLRAGATVVFCSPGCPPRPSSGRCDGSWPSDAPPSAPGPRRRSPCRSTSPIWPCGTRRGLVPGAGRLCVRGGDRRRHSGGHGDRRDPGRRLTVPLVLGVDSSTQSTKVEVPATPSRRRPWRRPRDGPHTLPSTRPRSEQDPAAWWEALRSPWPRPRPGDGGRGRGVGGGAAARTRRAGRRRSRAPTGQAVERHRVGAGSGPHGRCARPPGVGRAHGVGAGRRLHGDQAGLVGCARTRGGPGRCAVLLPHDYLTWRLTGRRVTDRGDAVRYRVLRPVERHLAGRPPRRGGGTGRLDEPAAHPARPDRARRTTGPGGPGGARSEGCRRRRPGYGGQHGRGPGDRAAPGAAVRLLRQLGHRLLPERRPDGRPVRLGGRVRRRHRWVPPARLHAQRHPGDRRRRRPARCHARRAVRAGLYRAHRHLGAHPPSVLRR